jgi:aryl-alcohol dehydrogenase-like predicted oxidoreductase
MPLDAPTPALAHNAAAGGHFRIGGDIEIVRLGFGAMRITGTGIWGPPANKDECLRVLRRLPELGVDFIDTADSYGPGVSEDLIAEALYPYSGLLIATKGGLARGGPNIWTPAGRPEVLRQNVQDSLRRLKIDRIDLWQLHRIDPAVPAEDQFGVVADMIKEGLIRHAGLSEVTVAQAQAAQAYFPVCTIQNQYNLVDRKSEAVLDWCEEHGVGFIPWFPLGAGALAKPGGAVDQVAARLHATPGQVALAWVLKRSPVMLPIPGTSRVSHLEENVAAASVVLSDEDFAALDEAGKRAR